MIDTEDTISLSDSDDDLSGTITLPPTIKTIYYSRSRNSHDYIRPYKLADIDRRENKYRRLREVKDISGFIVNVHDATNFDIDLDIPSHIHDRYSSVITNTYSYQVISDNLMKNPSLLSSSSPHTGTTYRCRLRGVGINHLPSSVQIWKNNQVCVNVKQLIDRVDGWVTCTLSDIDVYQRLLVDICIHTTSGNIDLKDYLLTHMIGDDTPIFYPYTGKKERK